MAHAFTVALTRTAYGHLEALRPYDRGRVLDAIRDQLTFGPDEQTRKRNKLVIGGKEIDI